MASSCLSSSLCCAVMRRRSARNPAWIILYATLCEVVLVVASALLIATIMGNIPSVAYSATIGVSIAGLVMIFAVVLPPIKIIFYPHSDPVDNNSIRWSAHGVWSFTLFVYVIACIGIIADNRSNLGGGTWWARFYNIDMINNIAIVWTVASIADIVILYGAFGTDNLVFLYIMFIHSTVSVNVSCAMTYINIVQSGLLMGFHVVTMFTSFLVITWKTIPFKCDCKVDSAYMFVMTAWQIAAFTMFVVTLSNGPIIDNANYRNTIMNVFFVVQPIPIPCALLYALWLMLKLIWQCLPECVSSCSGCCIDCCTTYQRHWKEDIAQAKQETKGYQTV